MVAEIVKKLRMVNVMLHWIAGHAGSDLSTSAFLGTDPSLLPTPGFSGLVNGSDIWTYKYAQDTRLDCYLYGNGSDFGTSTACTDVAKAAGVTASNLTS